jgi:hypothetical protein
MRQTIYTINPTIYTFCLFLSYVLKKYVFALRKKSVNKFCGLITMPYNCFIKLSTREIYIGDWLS